MNTAAVPTMTLPPPRVSLTELRVLDVLAAAGFLLRDGWFYPPGGSERALVRVSVGLGQYQICRRRNVRSPWMFIVTADVEDFDTKSFDNWRASWPLSA